jgi:hypothetical protein
MLKVKKKKKMKNRIIKIPVIWKIENLKFLYSNFSKQYPYKLFYQEFTKKNKK